MTAGKGLGGFCVCGIIVILLLTSLGAAGEEPEIVEKIEYSTETSFVRLYEHLEPAYNSSVLSLYPYPPSSGNDSAIGAGIILKEQKLFENNQSSLYDLELVGTDIEIHQFISCSRNALSSLITFTISDNNASEIASSSTSAFLGPSAIEVSTTISLPNSVTIPALNELYLKIEASAILGGIFKIHSTPSQPSYFEFEIAKPIGVGFTLEIYDDYIDIYWIHTTPLGGYNLNDISRKVTGPTPEYDLWIDAASLIPESGTGIWSWKFTDDATEPGEYTISVNVTTNQGVQHSVEYVYNVEYQDDTDGETGLIWYVALFVLGFILMIIILIGIKRRHRKNE